MPKEARAQLLALAKEKNLWLLEDDYDGELYFENALLPALASLDSRGKVIYMGSFTKAIYPGFNIGYLSVPQNLIKAFEGAKLLNDRHSSEVHQRILSEFIGEGYYFSHLRRLKNMYKKRRASMLSGLATLKEFGYISGPASGTHICFIFSRHCRDDQISLLLKNKYFIESRPLSACYREGKPQQGLLLGFVHFPEEVISQAIARLKRCLEEYFNQSI